MAERFRKTYRYYDPLMDACFYAALVMLLYSKGLRLFLTREEILALPMTPLMNVIVSVSILVMYFIIAAGFMRDEFAQKIWTKTAATFAYFVLFIPVIVFAAVASFGLEIYLWFEAGGELFDDRLDTPLSIPVQKDPADVVQFVMFYGLVEAVLQVMVWSPALFIAIYKFYRWRES